MTQLLLALAAVLISRAIGFVLLEGATEDALITFRVARNLAEGAGPYFNPGEHTGSVTSLPWTVWLALGQGIGFEILTWARASSLACDVLTVLAAWRILGPGVLGFGVLFALPLFSAATASGLETSAFTCALLWSALGLRGTAALVLLRPEGILAAALEIRRATPWHTVVAIGASIAIALANVALFAHPFPTAAAKAATYGLHPFAGWLWISPLMPLAIGGSPVGMLAHLEHFRILALPALGVGIFNNWRARLWLPCVAVLALYWVTGTTGFWWYAVPWLAGLAVWAVRGSMMLPLPREIAGAAVLLALSLWVPGFEAARATWASERPLAAVGARLAGEHGTVFLEPVGHVGWAAPNLRVVDEVGLVTPEVATRRTGAPGWWTDVVRRERPDWIVARVPFLNDPTRAWAGAGDPVRGPEDWFDVAQHYELHGAPVGQLVILRRKP